MKFLMFLLLFSCAKFHQDKATANTVDDLRVKYEKVLAISKQNLDEEGWPKDVSCDGFTFTSIYVLAGGSSNIFLAQDKNIPGKYYRDAKHLCTPDNGLSSTTNSQDGFLPFAAYLWKTKDIIHPRQIVEYWDSNDHYAGDPHTGASAVNSEIYKMYKQLSGNSGQFAESLPNLDGFRAHLLVWYAFDQGLLHGKLSEIEFQILRDQAKRQPRNSLYSAMYAKFNDGDQTAAINDLMDETRWPSDKSCSTKERCVPYLWSTDDTSYDWDACPDQNKTFTCIDWLIVAKIILGEV